MDNDKQEITRREFLTWLAAGAALFALPGGGSIARAAAPSWAFADLDFPAVDIIGERLVIPDPPPPIVNPPGVVTPPRRMQLSARRAVQAPAPAAPAAPAASAAPAQHSQIMASYAPPQANYNYQQQPTVVAAAYTPQEYQQPHAVQVAAQTQQRVRLSATTGQTAARATTPTVARETPPSSFSAPTEKVSALSRRMWANVAANPGKMRPMGQVKRITIHHEGSEKPNNDVMPFDVVATLRMIHGQHRKRMGAGDIGYHFIIDRTGMIWQGRDWVYQGAHTSGANVNNLGVMLLGNFEVQRPTQAQLDSLNKLVASLVRKFELTPSRDLYGHSDFCKTQCPGNNLRPYVENLRGMVM